MKKIISIITIMVLLLVGLVTFSGCEDSEKESKKSSSKKDSVVTEKDDEDEDKDEKSDKDDEDEDEDKKSDKDDEDEDEDKKSDKDDKDEDEDKKSDKDDKDEDEDKKSDSKETANLGSKYVDLDNRSFSVNGKVYKLGVNTLQDMIDDGVPFEEDDLANAGNNINKNSSSQAFSIKLGEYYSCSVYVSNFTNENKKISECPITEIYFPVRQDEKQDIVSFAFPLNITEEQLLNNAGTPTDKSEYNGDNGYTSRTYKYTKESTKYYGNSGYSFEFINGELRYLRISFKE